eukprot:CAMPEP_0117419340 /NCGR_PEP_ID=MMETSP0758-20121206/928_1 /TAXON_ID=63605 /ORGANISM="Percolomonas cosmopolitus, Strain AE-1 (ATCC 50343)" /LENGTH=172 /DNA_ID=CAMNT_0005200359 /DNA_START=922 /DNA_END=1437 /DNA_ORIENTATION=-
MNNATINMFLSNIPANSCVILEDIDACFRSSAGRNSNKDVLMHDLGMNSSRVTFSGLLNALDGIQTKEGRVLFMTTNHFESLQASLIRPGRVDLKIKFDYATKEQIYGLTQKFFKEPEGLPDQLTQLIPDKTITPAELQGFFLLHRSNPEALPEKVPAFLEEIAEERDREVE